MIPVSAIIFCNEDISDSAKYHLRRQLHITHVLDGYTFDLFFNSDDNDGYATSYGSTQYAKSRVLVLRTFQDRGTVETWTQADVVIFIKNGLAAVEQNKFGPPGQTFPVLQLNWAALGVL